MLRTRVVTALVLLAVFLLILYINSYSVFALAIAVFFCAAIWESLRLFDSRLPLQGAALWTAAFLFLAFNAHGNVGESVGGSVEKSQLILQPIFLVGLSSAIWAVRLVPSLGIGLPPLKSIANRLLNGIYSISLLACVVAMLVLFQHSSTYLFSVLAVVWIADIGAYFSGKAFGRRKLAPAISPGKSWEGAIGGWIAVLLFAAIVATIPAFHDTFPARLHAAWGWGLFIPVMSLLVAASVVGDLFESQLKRRIGMKDSSNLLPGHGGVLDRIDALIPVLPLAVLFGHWMPQ